MKIPSDTTYVMSSFYISEISSIHMVTSATYIFFSRFMYTLVAHSFYVLMKPKYWSLVLSLECRIYTNVYQTSHFTSHLINSQVQA